MEKKLEIRGLRASPPLFLAPMAGVTHTALRQLVASFGGCGCFYSEMLNARSLPHESPEASFFLSRTPAESPMIYQIVTADPYHARKAAERLHRCGADGVDLNMGCAAPFIVKQGAGAALMKDPEASREVVSALRRSTDLPVLAKLRIGWTADEDYLVRFCLGLEEAGADAVVLHARLCKDRFKRPPRWSFIRLLKERLSIPVIGNGDVTDAESARRMIQQTRCDGLMIGRAAACRPWLFRTIQSALRGEPECEAPDPREVFRTFVTLLEAHFPPERRLGRLKEFTSYFARNFAFGHALWKKVQGSKSVEQALERALEFLGPLALREDRGYRPRLADAVGSLG